MTIYLKNPQAELDYAVDWPGAFTGGSPIAVSEWTVAPDESGGISVSASSVEGNRSTARLGGGVAGHVYHVANRVVLADGRSDERSLVLRVEER